jgi:hypothetical protein
MNTRNNFIIILISLLIACSKEPNKEQEQIVDNYCTPVETGIPIPRYNLGGFGYKYVPILENNSYYPCVSPLNTNEFAYILSYKEKSGLYIYNMVQKSSSLVIKFVPKVYNGYPAIGVRWSKKNWLIFEDLYNNVFKVKPNGDSLIQLTFTGSDFKPEWNFDGTLFCTEHYSNIVKKHFTIIRNELGNEIDTIQYGNIQAIGAPPSWNNEKYILGTNDIGIILYDFKIKIVKEIPTDLSIGFPSWFSNNEFVYSGINGIYTYNILNSQVKQIRSTINSNQYNYVNMLPNKQMICERNYLNLIDSANGIIAYKTNICLINPCDTIITDFDLR